jgi:hypothetical protein
MRQKATKDYTGTEIIPAKYVAAIGAITAGQTVTQAAESIGVTRQHLSRLLNKNPYIMAEYSRQKHELSAQVRDKITAIVSKAADVIDKALDDPAIPIDARASMAIHIVGKVAPLLDFQELGPVDEDTIVHSELHAERTDMQYALMDPIGGGVTADDVAERLGSYAKEL